MGGYIIALEQADPAFLQRVRPRGFERALWDDDIDNARVFGRRDVALRLWDQMLRGDASGHRIVVTTVDEALVWRRDREPPAPVYLCLLADRMRRMVGAGHDDCARLCAIGRELEAQIDRPGWNGKT